LKCKSCAGQLVYGAYGKVKCEYCGEINDVPVPEQGGERTVIIREGSRGEEKVKEKKSWTKLILIWLTIMGILFGIAAYEDYVVQPNKATSKIVKTISSPTSSVISYGIEISGAAYVFGPSDAPVTMIEFTDYQCPFCKRYADETFDDLLQVYGNKIKYVFMDFPLTQMHPQSFVTHEAARCAGDQGKYMEYHNKLFANQKIWSNYAPESEDEINELKKYAQELGLNSQVFDECLISRQYSEAIIASSQIGIDAGVTGAPSFFINGVYFGGARPISDFQSLIETELSKLG